MSEIHQLLNQINKSSFKILEELKNEEPSFTLIIEELQSREKYVANLGGYVDSYDEASLEEEELDSLKEKFETFTRLNTEIEAKAKYLLQFQKKKLASATKRRKAEDSYNVSLDPNVSYFLTSEV